MTVGKKQMADKVRVLNKNENRIILSIGRQFTFDRKFSIIRFSRSAENRKYTENGKQKTVNIRNFLFLNHLPSTSYSFESEPEDSSLRVDDHIPCEVTL